MYFAVGIAVYQQHDLEFLYDSPRHGRFPAYHAGKDGNQGRTGGEGEQSDDNRKGIENNPGSGRSNFRQPPGQQRRLSC